MLCRIQKNSPQFDPDDVIDLIGEDFDVDDAEDEEDKLDEIDVPLEHVLNFWSSIINRTNVDLSFTRPGEGERLQRRKRKFTREKDRSMPRNAILKHLVPINDGQHVVHDKDAEDDILEVMKVDAIEQDFWDSTDNMECAIKELKFTRKVIGRSLILY